MLRLVLRGSCNIELKVTGVQLGLLEMWGNDRNEGGVCRLRQELRIRTPECAA
jgi:hypothetical protein